MIIIFFYINFLFERIDFKQKMNFNKSSPEERYNNNATGYFVDEKFAKNTFLGLSESEIWTKFREGNEAAFVHIYEKYFSTLFSYAHRFCQQRESAKDHIQDMFVDLRKNKKRLGDTSSIKYYLFSSLRRRILRTESRKPLFVSTSDNLDNYDFEAIISPEQKFINNQMNKKIKEILTKNISRLSTRQKEAIMYYYYEGFSYDQVSRLMGFSKVKYARTLIYRSIKQMKENIKVSEIISLYMVFLFI